MYRPKRLAQRLIERAGYSVTRMPGKTDGSVDSLEALATELAQIPGMISPGRGVHHYLLAYAQSLKGDIIEVGSWQGRNTCFLAAACRDSDNGVVHAIDHFEGNPGNRDAYVVHRRDLSDLELKFHENVRRVGVADYVQLHPTDARSAKIDGPIRMLFIDAEHTYGAVQADLAQFVPLVAQGGIVAFDDYASDAPGVVPAVDDWLRTVDAAKPIISGRTLAVRLH